MASFGADSSSNQGEGETLRPNPKQIAANGAPKSVKQKGAHVLPTPESTPGPDTTRLEVDSTRREAEALKAPNIRDQSGPLGGDTAALTVNKGKGPKSSQIAQSSKESSNDESDKVQTDNKQKSEVKRVLECKPDQYYRILGVEDPSTEEEKQKAFLNLAVLIRPDRNKHEGAGKAFQRAYTAAKALGIESEEYAENAYGDETDEDDGANAMDIEQSEAPKPDDLRQKIYAEATPFLGELMENPMSAEAKSALQDLNSRIRAQNRQDGLPKADLENFVIQIETFVANFNLSKPYYEALKKDQNDEKARENLANINNMLDQLNKRHGYPATWLIGIPDRPSPNQAESSKPAGSSEAAASEVSNEAGQPSSKGGVKTKVDVLIRDESDGSTSLGQVVYVRKAGFGSRVIVNRGTEQNPYFEIYPGADFGKGVAKEWLESEIYDYAALPKDTEAKNMTIYGRVKVKRISRKRETETLRTQSEIQYYLVKVGIENYLSTKSALSGMKGLSPAKLKRIDVQLDRQNEQLLAELDQCREKNEHPDTGEQLTSEEIQEMPWLSRDANIQTQDEKQDEDGDDENVGNIVPQRMGLKRNANLNTTSRNQNS